MGVTFNKGKVGITIPVYNARKYLDRCINSVKRQTYRNIKIYMVDDCSTDGIRLKTRNKVNMGWSFTTNKAATLAIKDKCEYIFLLNADDWLRRDAIELMVKEICETRVDAIVPWGRIMGGENVYCVSQKVRYIKEMIYYCPIVSYCLIKSAVWNNLGGYSRDIFIPEIKAGLEDWDFWIRFFLRGYCYRVLAIPVYFKTKHKKQLSKITCSEYYWSILYSMLIEKYFKY